MKSVRYNKPLSLCWSCQKSTHSGCSWSKNFTPVKGWDAEPTSIVQYTGNKKEGRTEKTITHTIRSFSVKACPEFVEG